jgi:hypothetical protein
VVEDIAPMMPAPFAVRARNDLMIHKAVHLIHEPCCPEVGPLHSNNIG